MPAQTESSTTASAAVIELAGIGFAYGAQRVLKSVSLSVGQGEIYGLVGADGAGKSTLLRIGVGQLTPDAGSARLLGHPMTDPTLRHRLAYMPQGFGLYPDLSVQENLEFFADLHGLSAQTTQQKIRDLLGRTGMQAFTGRRAGQLSGGMMQKLALACALISEPQAMFLDEPTTGVDPVSRRAFWQLLSAVRAEGVAILYATANLDEAERCDRVGLLENGRLSRQGTPQALAQTSDAQALRLTGHHLRETLDRLRSLPGVELVFPRGQQATLWVAADVALNTVISEIKRIDPHCQIEPAPASLQETVLRELALRETAPTSPGSH